MAELIPYRVWDEFVTLLERGGLLYMHSATLKAMETAAESEPIVWLDLVTAKREGRVKTNNFLDPNVLCGVDVDAIKRDTAARIDAYASPPFPWRANG